MNATEIVGITSLIWLVVCALVAWLARRTGRHNGRAEMINRRLAELRRCPPFSNDHNRLPERPMALRDVPPVPLVQPELERGEKIVALLPNSEITRLRRLIDDTEAKRLARINSECAKTLAIKAQREGGGAE